MQPKAIIKTELRFPGRNKSSALTELSRRMLNVLHSLEPGPGLRESIAELKKASDHLEKLRAKKILSRRKAIHSSSWLLRRLPLALRMMFFQLW